MMSPINQTIIERISLYTDNVNSTKAYTLEKIDAVDVLYRYLLTPAVKALWGGSDEGSIRSRDILFKKTDSYMDELETRYWVCRAFPLHREIIEEMMKFLTNAPNESWTQPLRRSERIRQNFIDSYTRSFQPTTQETVEFSAKLAANYARMAELQGTGPRRPTVSIKVLPRRSARLMRKQ
jgi:hypothetical protein